ncbi:MAG: PAS domain S-box protein, partial [Candidatus Thermoplasmatota archaeon]|nr:PAS domain S-box protein [Candidatus Thermoplasmatota archaeon]
ITNLSVFDIIHPESKEHCMKIFKRIMYGENIENIETSFVTKDGRKIIVEGSISCRFKDGKSFSTRGIFRDITNRKKMENALRESEEKFRVVLENSLNMIYQLNIKTNTYDYVSPSSIKVLGYSPEEIISFGVKKMNDLIHPDDKKILKNHFNKLVNHKEEKETIQALEYRIKHKNLGYRWVSDIRSVIFDENGEAVAIVGNAKDITEQRKVWDEMVKSEEKYRVLAETSADGVFTTDVLGRLTYVNPSLEKMMGRRKSKILATPFKNYLSESSVYSFQQIIVDIRKNDQKMENIELEITHEDGYDIPVEVNIAPLKKEGVFVGIECTLRDVSEREKVVRELKKSENLRTEFMNIAAHELKSPVTPIKGYLELIESDKDVDEKIRKWARIALRNAERVLLLVNDILDVSRLDTDTMRFNMEKIDSVKILDDAAEDMKPAIKNKNLKFIKEIPKDLPEIFADKYRLSQVLKNLLGNAIKFTDYGSISLKASIEENHLRVSVEDTGVGISSDELKKIFAKLYQAYTGEDRKNEGAGLGLYICKEIIRKHKGEIWAKSEIGKGSSFFIKLPI